MTATHRSNLPPPPFNRSPLNLFALLLLLALTGCILFPHPTAPDIRQVTPAGGTGAVSVVTQSAAGTGAPGQVITATTSGATSGATGATSGATSEATSGATSSGATSSVATAAAVSATTSALATQTANPCQPPAGWVLHAVRQDETLYYLSTSTGVKVEEVMKANCLASDVLQVGQIVSLPSVPPARPTYAPQAAGSPPQAAPAAEAAAGPAAGVEEANACPSMFSCPIGGYPPLDFDAGSPGDPTFQPCPTQGIQAIRASFEYAQAGDRLLFFACNFKLPLALANVTYPDGTAHQIDLVRSLPGYPADIQGRIIDFPVLPDLPISADPYRLVVTGADGQTALKRFWVQPAAYPRILVTPLSGSADKGFEIYYIYFPYQSTIGVVLYGEDSASNTSSHALTALHSWSTKIDRPWTLDNKGMGWAKEVIAPDPADPKAAYAIDYNNQDPANPLELKAHFWVR